MRAVKASRIPAEAGLDVQHRKRVQCAENYLPISPLAEYGVSRLISDAREGLAQLVNPASLGWLPNVGEHFKLAKE